MAFEHRIRVYWEDTDAGGIVFYANYLKFFERARTEWLRSLGIGQEALRQTTGGLFVVGETRVKYHRPARLDDQLVVTSKLIEKGRASLSIEQTALLISEHEGVVLLCEGRIRIGWIDSATFRPARIPKTILEALQ